MIIWGGLRFTIRAGDERRVTRVEIVKVPLRRPGSPATDGAAAASGTSVCGFKSGNSTTSRIDAESVNSIASRSIPIPVRMSNGAPGNRSCTLDYKIALMSKWLKANGATKDNPALVGIGISVDEIERAMSELFAA